MDYTWNVTQYSQEDVDEEVGIATALEEDAEGREDDSKDNFADVARVRDNVSDDTHQNTTRM